MGEKKLEYCVIVTEQSRNKAFDSLVQGFLEGCCIILLARFYNTLVFFEEAHILFVFQKFRNFKIILSARSFVTLSISFLSVTIWMEKNVVGQKTSPHIFHERRKEHIICTNTNMHSLLLHTCILLSAPSHSHIIRDHLLDSSKPTSIQDTQVLLICKIGII